MAYQRLATTQQSTSKSQESQEHQSQTATKPQSHPVMQLQRSLGNRAIQRLIENARRPVQRAALASREESDDPAEVQGFKAQLGQRQGLGTPLPEQARAFLEPRLGIDLNSVRVHTGGEAHKLAGAVNATAFTTGTDIFFRDGAYNPSSSEGMHLLTHEVTHVLQQSLGPVAGNPVEGSEIAISDPADQFEQEADKVAGQVMAISPSQEYAGDTPSAPASDPGLSTSVQREEDDDWWSGIGDVVGDVGSFIASGAESVVDAGADVAGDVGSALASGAETVWDVGSNLVGEAGSAIAAGADTVVNTGSEVASGIYSGMKQAGKAVHGAEQWVEGGIGDLMSMSKEGWNMLAEEAEGIPVIEDLASGAAWVGGHAADFTGGVLKGATHLVGGVAGMVVNPVDTAIGLRGLAEHARIAPGMPNPLQVAHGLYNVIANDADLGSELNRTLNPAEITKGDYTMLKGLATGIAQPYIESYEQGNYGEMAGRGVFDIAMLLLGAGEAGAAAKGAEAAGVARGLGAAAEGAEAANVVRGLGAAAEGAEAANVARGLGTAAEGTGALSAAGRLEAAAEGGEVARALGEATEATTPLSGMRIETLGTPTGELAALSEAEIDAFLAGMESGGARSGSFFELPGQNPLTGGGLQDITTRINPNANQIAYNVNHYLSDVGSVRIAEMAEVPIGGPRGLGGSVIPEGVGTTAEATPRTFLSTAENNPVLNAAEESIGSSNVEVRYHAANPRFPDQGPTVQINTPSDRFGWAGNRAITVGGETGRYLLPDGTWIDMATLQAQIRAARNAGNMAEAAALEQIAESAHWPVGHQ